MKKLFVLSVFLMFIFLNIPSIKAEDYRSYQELVFEDEDVLLLKEFSSSNYNTYYKQIKKRKMFGWMVNVVHKNEPVEFVAETKLKVYNNGYSTIKYDINLSKEVESKFQISASYGVKVEVGGTIDKFKGAVDRDIKSSISYTKVTTTKEDYSFKIDVDPKTYVKVIVRGTGEINNGVAKLYFLWMNTTKGGWEPFTVKSEYYEIVKERIR